LIPLDGYTRKNNNFDFIRLSMTSLVVRSHAFALYFGTEDHEPLSLVPNDDHSSGNIGVMGFFIISGFQVMQFHRDEVGQALHGNANTANLSRLPCCDIDLRVLRHSATFEH
jgi:hypothetical protein